MTNLPYRLLISIPIAIAIAASVASAETVLVGNLSEPVRAATPIADPEFWGAQSFTVDAAGCELSSIIARVGNGANEPAVVAELRKSDITGEIDMTPGGLLTTFSPPGMFGAPSARYFTPDMPVALNPSETYWFLLGSSNAGTYDWEYAETNFSTGPGSLGNFADSSDAGATWINRGNDFPYFIQVNCASPRGACCMGNGGCFADVDAFNCQVEFNGTYLGDGTVCEATSCCSEAVMVSNVSEPFRDNTPIANPEFWGAQSFSPGAGDHLVTSIEAMVGNGAGSPLVVAELRTSDVDGEIDVTPGGLLATFAAPDLSGAPSMRLFTPEYPVSVTGAETYWFLLGSSNAGTYDWSYANTSNFTGSGTLGNFADSSDAGATWSNRGNDFPYFIQVNVNCGEPLGACCLGAGVCQTLTSSDCSASGGVYMGDGAFCGSFSDGDEFSDCEDNCPTVDNPEQSDTDGDGVGDACDICPNTVPGSTVDVSGCPPIIPFDFDVDGDVDETDFAVFSGCGSGATIPHDGSSHCARADSDSDGDGDVDADDFGAFQRCYSGMNEPGRPDCNL